MHLYDASVWLLGHTLLFEVYMWLMISALQSKQEQNTHHTQNQSYLTQTNIHSDNTPTQEPNQHINTETKSTHSPKHRINTLSQEHNQYTLPRAYQHIHQYIRSCRSQGIWNHKCIWLLLNIHMEPLIKDLGVGPYLGILWMGVCSFRYHRIPERAYEASIW